MNNCVGLLRDSNGSKNLIFGNEMNLIHVAILLVLQSSIVISTCSIRASNHVSSVVENKTTRAREIVETTENIRPTKTIKLSDYVRLNFNESDVSFPFISSFFILDYTAVEILENFTKQYNSSISSQHLQLINKYVSEWKERICINCLPDGITSQNISKLTIPEVVGNPETSFLIIKRLEIELPDILLYDKNSIWKDLVVEKYYSKLSEIGFYNENYHYVTFGLGLFRLHHVYNIPIEEMLPPNSINAVHNTAEIGHNAFSQGFFGRAAEWYQYGKKILANQTESHKNFSHSLTDIKENFEEEEERTKRIYLEILANITMQFHDLWVEKKGSNSRPGLFAKPFYQMSIEEQVAKGYDENQSPKAPSADEYDELMFRKLCQGHEPRTQEVLKELNCRYDHRGSKWLLLMPSKLEVANLDPEILIFHNAVSEKRMNFMKNISLPIQEEAYVQDAKINSGRRSKERMSYISWVSEMIHEETKKLAIMVSALTGLHASDEKGSAELFQMNVYGSGGFYNVHDDAFNYYEKLESTDDDYYDDGDRLATFMIYMNEVKGGGRTVFPQLGVGVEPENGSAVFWINLLHSGKTNKNMKHAGCPVISGIKWVTNRWIRVNEQMFIRPCRRKIEKELTYTQKSTISKKY